jgi:hypothetical protein
MARRAGGRGPRRSFGTLLLAILWLLRRRVRYVAILAALSVATIVLLVVAYDTTGYVRDLSLNVGASLVIVIVTYLIFDPVIQGLRAASTREHPKLNFELFIERVANARRTVCILETWTRLLDPEHRGSFLQAARDAVSVGVTVQILLLDPDSYGAKQRDEEIGPDRDVPKAIMGNLLELYRFRHQLSEPLRERFAVRIYSASASVQLYRSDDRAFLSFFSLGRLAGDTPKLETNMATPWGEFVGRRFDELLVEGGSLDGYMKMPLVVKRDDVVHGQFSVHFVWLDGDFFVTESGLLKHIAKHGIENLTAHPDNGPDTRAQPIGPCDLRMLDDDHLDLARVAEAFEAKYGNRNEIIVCLVPSEAARAHEGLHLA